jgi:hypothetical protein
MQLMNSVVAAADARVVVVEAATTLELVDESPTAPTQAETTTEAATNQIDFRRATNQCFQK